VQHHKTDSKQSSEVEMSEEQDLNQTNPEALATSSVEPAELDSYSDDPAFAALIKRYGLTPQQAKEIMLYL
jgi:hypothetical protein